MLVQVTELAKKLAISLQREMTRLAQSGHSLRRNNLSAFGQERTLFGTGAHC
jgi:hypothetical protein